MPDSWRLSSHFSLCQQWLFFRAHILSFPPARSHTFFNPQQLNYAMRHFLELDEKFSAVRTHTNEKFSRIEKQKTLFMYFPKSRNVPLLLRLAVCYFMTLPNSAYSLCPYILCVLDERKIYFQQIKQNVMA